MLTLLLLSACFGSHHIAYRDAGPDAAPVPACWPEQTAAGVFPCTLAPGEDNPCQCDGNRGAGCVPYATVGRAVRGSCFDLAEQPGGFELCPDPFNCENGRVCTVWRQGLIDAGADPAVVRDQVVPVCMPPDLCTRVREDLGLDSNDHCVFADLSVTITGVIPAPSCAERPGGIQLCGAGCECDAGYECGDYSEAHPWAPCYPAGRLVPSMPFDGAWMTRIASPEEAARAEGRTEWERHYVDPAYCDAVAAQFPGRFTCDSLSEPSP
ncbi:MAG: hypothetical protein GXP55_23085 [Deltaproteobacteria bacterium]|nr:hypothetical protein [Deltaproteobacteria bacterium]